MKNGKYYQIRKELIWGMGLLAALIACTGVFGAVERWRESHTDQVLTERKVLPEIQSELADPEGCYLCGTAPESLMGYFRQFDDLGIISVNPWYVLDLGILLHEGDGTDTSGTRTAMTGTGEGGDFFSSTQTPSRGISTVEVSYGEDSILNVEKAKAILCQDCLDKLLAVMETYGPEGEDPEPRDLCLVDFQTLELYSLQEQYASYYIRDYYVRLDQTDDGMEVEAVYAPDCQ